MMAVIRVDDPDDPRLLAYRQLKDRHLAEQQGLFIAEGEQLVRRLLASPRIETRSVLVAEHRAAGLLPAVPRGVPVYVMPESRLSSVLGYAFHRGMLACGVRPAMHRLDDLLPARTLVVCPHLQDVENLGVIIRTAAALGMDGVIVGERGADPFMRRCVRVSMGSVFTMPIVQSPWLEHDLIRLRDEFDTQIVATVLGEGAIALDRYEPGPRIAVLLGSEPAGLDRSLIDLCTHRVTIAMSPGTDSLNVAVAAGIVMHHVQMTRQR